MRIKNWSKFQHFKDRRPPWIKLYRDILDDLDWHELDARASKVLVMCWLIASEHDGNLPDIKTLAFRLRMSEKDTKDCIIKLSHWLDQDDIAVISQGYQSDLLETETEKEKRQISNRGTRLPQDFLLPDDWQAFCHQERPELNARQVFEQFKDYWVALPAGKGTKADWFATWRNWVRRQSVPKIAPADIARVTVPGTKERDPVLVKLDQEKDLVSAMPEDIKEKLNLLRRKV